MCFHPICFAFKKVVLSFVFADYVASHCNRAGVSLVRLWNTSGTMLVLFLFISAFFGWKSPREKKDGYFFLLY